MDLDQGPTFRENDAIFMPAKNVRKHYVSNVYYHIYNRGVDGRKIFTSDKDCKIFLYYLKRYLAPRDDPDQFIPSKIRMLQENLKLICYCLMPTHFHLLVYQKVERAITEIMRRVCTGYVSYFNKEHGRRGSLFESNYKAAIIDSELYFLHLSRYINLNPQSLDPKESVFDHSWKSFRDYPYSSYGEYIGRKKAKKWLDTEPILELFQPSDNRSSITLLVGTGIGSYKDFVEDYSQNSQELLGELCLDAK